MCALRRAGGREFQIKLRAARARAHCFAAYSADTLRDRRLTFEKNTKLVARGETGGRLGCFGFVRLSPHKNERGRGNSIIIFTRFIIYNTLVDMCTHISKSN